MQITECHGNERALKKKKKGKIMLSSNCLLFVRKCVKYDVEIFSKWPLTFLLVYIFITQ